MCETLSENIACHVSQASLSLTYKVSIYYAPAKPAVEANQAVLRCFKYCRLVATLGAGDALGEMALLKQGGLRSATVQATTDCEVQASEASCAAIGAKQLILLGFIDHTRPYHEAV